MNVITADNRRLRRMAIQIISATIGPTLEVAQARSHSDQYSESLEEIINVYAVAGRSTSDAAVKNKTYMITIDGYSKDPNIIPEGIAVTFGREMLEEQGGVKRFLQHFEEWISQGENYWWLHKCKNKPQADISYVYVIVLNRLYCRCYYGGHESRTTIGKTADGKLKNIDWPRIVLAGPIEKPKFKRTMRGFQGFRYTTKLF
jgi:hypothetical protein